MSELRSAIDALRAESLTDLPDALVEERSDELNHACEQLELERLRAVREIDRRRAFERDGHLSCAGWLVARWRVSWSEARAKVRLARSLERMHITRRAVEDGEVSMAGARVLAKAEHAQPEAFPAAEETLVEAARAHSVGALQRVASFWCHQVEDRERWRAEDRLRSSRRLHVSRTFEGMVRIDGDLDPETGETVLIALNAVVDAEVRGPAEDDPRLPEQRRADALGEICRQFLNRSDRPQVGGERPHLTVTVDLETFRGRGGTAELEGVGAISADVARRIACDASIQRVVLSPASEPLDIGRKTAVVPPALRRAVILRDRHCRFPGCDRPPAWCDAHHVVPWSHGGPTSLANLGLLCRRHHRLVHPPNGFGMTVVDGELVFTRPDGSRLEGRAPPRAVAV
jgi:hypothetical protein